MPIANALPTRNGRMPSRVGFALRLETFTQIYGFSSFEKDADFHNLRAIWPEPKVHSALLARLSSRFFGESLRRTGWAKRVGSVIIQRRNSSRTRP
jgi:hypothetical protein